ncbi:40S ribosomal protein S0 [Rhizoctonia solani]|uniref:40S ribosomal protein S0 n=1 Tax=Rhizoctonia solani TaxID=456999 RepID=A0A8H8SX08_9AGAM|nr:40S ribosomal protein S0 [Rhizoctonia solani]QRW21596.1 40S ribosomal protein S0 [Rhizoctonia solani]
MGEEGSKTTRLTSRFAREDIAFLDAGLGTTLEDVLHKNISHPLWSAHLMTPSRRHCRGASCISQSWVFSDPYRNISVYYTQSNCSGCSSSRDIHEYHIPRHSQTSVALSLGPFGATLSPAAEFSGIYPPPYGPPQPVTFFTGEQALEDEQKAENALLKFHLERISMLASTKETWDAIDIIAFETVPLLREARAIRRAMTAFASANPSLRIPPWWISFNFPDGVLPEQTSQGKNYTAGDAVSACFAQHQADSTAIPDAFGINCTQVRYLHECVSLASDALQTVKQNPYSKSRPSVLDPRNLPSKSGPTLVVYPNGGRIYDPNTMTWLPAASESSETKGLSESDAWAIGLVDVLQGAVPEDSGWSGLLIGGCCKTEPEHVSALRKLL